jgi:hypothetical protein
LITIGGVSTAVRHDVARVNNKTGKVDVVEVLSLEQTKVQMIRKLEKSFGDSLGEVKCANQNGCIL